MINGCRPKERPGMDYFQFMQGVYHLGNNLNQIVHLAHRFGSFHTSKLEQFYEQFLAMVRLIVESMIAPDDLDVHAILKLGKRLAEIEQKNEEAQEP
jgi:hypothetical protein